MSGIRSYATAGLAVLSLVLAGVLIVQKRTGERSESGPEDTKIGQFLAQKGYLTIWEELKSLVSQGEFGGAVVWTAVKITTKNVRSPMETLPKGRKGIQVGIIDKKTGQIGTGFVDLEELEELIQPVEYMRAKKQEWDTSPPNTTRICSTQL